MTYIESSRLIIVISAIIGIVIYFHSIFVSHSDSPIDAQQKSLNNTSQTSEVISIVNDTNNAYEENKKASDIINISHIKTYKIRLICISDTHNKHDELTKELNSIYESEKDILIHAGDLTDTGSQRELKQVNEWFAKLRYKHIIITAGNMDGISLDRNRYKSNYHRYQRNHYDYKKRSNNKYTKSIFSNAVYLEHEPYYLQELDLKFFGSPYSMQFFGGFQIDDNEAAESLWHKIANDIDVLICHGPPYNILDETSRGKHTGDQILLDHVLNRVQPKVMIFGHMHSAFGHQTMNGIDFYNCAQENFLRKTNNYRNPSSSYYNSNKKENNMNNDGFGKPHIIDYQQLS